MLNEVQPTLLILCHSGNDFMRMLDEAQIASNICAVIKLVRDKHVATALIATLKGRLSVSSPDFYREFAKKFA